MQALLSSIIYQLPLPGPWPQAQTNAFLCYTSTASNLSRLLLRSMLMPPLFDLVLSAESLQILFSDALK